MNDKCGECSRRKFYQVGYEDGKNDNWIPIEKQLPKKHDTQRVWITVQTEQGFHTLKATWDGEKFVHTNTKNILYPVVAWKPYSAPKPYIPERSK